MSFEKFHYFHMSSFAIDASITAPDVTRLNSVSGYRATIVFPLSRLLGVCVETLVENTGKHYSHCCGPGSKPLPSAPPGIAKLRSVVSWSGRFRGLHHDGL